jgi:hypothetical protein
MVWSDMLARCENTRHHAYKWYGQKEISVCDEWRDFANFRNWAIGNGYKIGLTIDRIDGNGNYELSNCRWATRQEQSDHLSSCVFVDFMGEGLNITQFCKKYNVSQSHFRKIARNRYFHAVFSLKVGLFILRHYVRNGDCSIDRTVQTRGR